MEYSKIHKFSWPLFAALCLHFSFFLTGYIQEDAFITFRTGFNLADHGVYSFNVNESYPGATSLMYGFYTAGIRFIFGDFSIPIINLFNIIYSLVAGLLLFSSAKNLSIVKSSTKPFTESTMLFAATASPPILAVGSSGMETAILLLMMSAALFSISKNKYLPAGLILGVLPFARIDAIAFSLVCTFVIATYDKKTAAKFLLFIGLGLSALYISNVAVFGQFIPLTMEAKNLAYSPERDIISVMSRLWNVFFSASFVLGLSSKYIPTLIYTISGLLLIASASYLLKKMMEVSSSEDSKSSFMQNTPTRLRAAIKCNSFLLIVICSTFLIPSAYSLGGVIFPWYLWPYSVFALLIIAIAISTFNRVSSSFALSVVLLAISLFSALTHLNVGMQEAGYRASVGNYVRNVSNEADTLFLEPAGYIPFFAGVETWDTVGLASGTVVKYLEKSDNKWWIELVINELPTFIVEKGPIHLGAAVDRGYILNEKELDWFIDNYALDRKFIYKEYLDKNKSIMTPVFGLGSHSDYYLYKKKQ